MKWTLSLLVLLSFAGQAFAGMVCAPASEIAVTYEKQGQQVTDRRIFRDDATNAQNALAQYQAYAASLGGKVTKISRNQLVTCSTAVRSAAMLRAASPSPELTLTVTNGSTNGCRISYPSQSTVMVECNDGSVAIYNKTQDSVYVRPASQDLYNDMYRSTSAMNALLNQADLLTRPDWKQGSQAVTVSGADFDKVIAAAKAEAQGASFPKPEDLTKSFKNFKLTPLNDAMEKTFRQQQSRLQRFARVNSSFTMSPGQIQSYFERFVKGLEKLDDLSQRNTQVSDNEANKIVGDFVNDLVVTGQGGPFSAERRAAANAVLDSFAPNGIIPRPQNEELNSALQGMTFKTSLDDPSIDRRQYAAELRNAINKITGLAIRGGAELLKKVLVLRGWAGNADVAFSGLTEGDEEKGVRILDRLNAFFDYGQEKKPPMPGISLEQSALFHVGQLANTFENSEVVKAMKELIGETGLLDDPYYRFHAVLAINQALQSATGGNFSDFSTQIENAYAVLDAFRGFQTGLVLSVWSTVEGGYKAAAHPMNTSWALAMSMVNYGETWASLGRVIAEKYETIANCDQDTFACGEVSGKLAGDIYQFVTGIIALKAELTPAKLAEGSSLAAETVIDSAVDITGKAAKYGIDDAPKLEQLLEKSGALDCPTGCGIQNELNSAGEVLQGVDRIGPESMPAGGRITEIMQFRKRSLELAVEGNELKIREGIGGARLESVTGRKLTRSPDQSYDFIDSEFGRVEMKGPIRHPKTGNPIPITDEMMTGFVNSVLWEANYSTVANKIVVDTLGMSQKQIAELERLLSIGVNDLSKIIYIK